MTSFKVLTLFIIVAILLNINGCSPERKDKQFTFYNGKDTVMLKNNEYTIKQNSIGFDLTITDQDKQKEISDLDQPKIDFSINGKNVTAGGLYVLSAAMPKGLDYFFALNNKSRVFFLKPNTIEFTKISR